MEASQDIQRLVVLGSTVTALAIVRGCRPLGLSCTLVDTIYGPATRSRLADVRILDDDEEALAAIVELSSIGPSALVADSDRWLRWLVRHREVLETNFELVLHAPNPVLETCLNKTRFVRWCKEQALPVPDVFEDTSREALSDMAFPVLVRPDSTRHGRANELPKATEISSAAELTALLERYAKLGAVPNICQSLLRPNVQQFSVGVARGKNGESRILVAQKLRPTAEMCAGGTYVVSCPNENVASLAADTANALQLYGVAEIEIMKDEDSGELFLLEVNARPWVQYALATHSGFDFLTWLLRPREYDTGAERLIGKRWLSFGDDLYVVFSRSEGLLTKKSIALGDYILTVLRANVHPLWSWHDPTPFFVSLKERLVRRVRRGERVA